MEYSIDKLMTAEEVDSMEQIAQKELGDLQYRRTTLTRRVVSLRDRSTSLETEKLRVTTELSALETAMTGMDTSSDLYRAMSADKVRLDYRMFLLTEREESVGLLTQLDLELQVNQVIRQISEATGFVTALQARREALTPVPPQ